MVKLKHVCLMLFAFSLLGCSSNPAEEYVDYFYSNPASESDKSFTYILYLGEKGKSLSQHQKDHSSISPRSGQSGGQSNQRRSSHVKKGEEFTSLSFRMEEEAYRRLNKLLIEKAYCEGEIEYLESVYTWLRYSIKGRCKT